MFLIKLSWAARLEALLKLILNKIRCSIFGVLQNILIDIRIR